MIIFDPEGVAELLQYAKLANDNASVALSMLQRIHDHNDWCCQEKNQINDFCLSNKTKVQQLQSRTDDFYKVLSAIVLNSKSIHRTVINDISSIDTEILKSVAETINNATHTTPPVGSVGAGKISEIVKKISDDIVSQDIWKTSVVGEEIRNILSPIAVVKFPDLK